MWAPQSIESKVMFTFRYLGNFCLENTAGLLQTPLSKYFCVFNWNLSGATNSSNVFRFKQSTNANHWLSRRSLQLPRATSKPVSMEATTAVAYGPMRVLMTKSPSWLHRSYSEGNRGGDECVIRDTSIGLDRGCPRHRVPKALAIETSAGLYWSGMTAGWHCSR